MGRGIDLARPEAPEHVQILDDFKDQLLISLIRKLGGQSGIVDMPISEVDETGGFILMMSISDGMFHFEVKKKS